MTVGLKAEIPANRRLVIDLPPEIPTGLAEIVIRPADEASPLLEELEQLRARVETLERAAAERNQAEQVLRESEHKYRTLVEQIPALIYTLSLSEPIRTTYVSPQIEPMLGYTPEEWMRDRLWKETLHPDDRERVLALKASASDHEGSVISEHRVLTADGRVIWVQDEMIVVRDVDGQPLFRRGVVLDITARKEAEQALRESEHKYRTLVEQLPALVYTNDLGDLARTAYVNPQIEPMFGYTLEEWIGSSKWITTLHPDDKERVLAIYAYLQNYDGSLVSEHRMRAADGRIAWVHDKMIIVRDDDGQPLYQRGVVLDITARKEAEEALTESEFKYRTLVERIPALVYTSFSEEEGTTYISPQIKTMLGYSPEEWMGGELWSKTLHPDDRERVLALKSGLIENDAPIISEHRILAADGRVVWVRDEMILIHDDSGRPFFQQGVVFDITARKEADQKLMAAYNRLQELDHLKAEFIANVSHELRTPITSLKLYHQLLLRRPEKQAEYIATLRLETERLERIVEDLLYYSRMDRDQIDFQPQAVDLNALVSRFVADRVALAEQKGLTLTHSQHPELPSVQADAALLGRVLNILLDNAFNYTPAGGSVSISTVTCQHENAPWVGIAVSDTGPGIPSDEVPRLFERFFRGKSALETGTPGTGIGLAIVYEIAQHHAGWVEVVNNEEADTGTTFNMWLPVEGQNES